LKAVTGVAEKMRNLKLFRKKFIKNLKKGKAPHSKEFGEYLKEKMEEAPRKREELQSLIAAATRFYEIMSRHKLRCDSILLRGDTLKEFMVEAGKSMDWVEDSALYKVVKGEIIRVTSEDEVP
jgi:hypothetical protein